jgi:hypothetical protein
VTETRTLDSKHPLVLAALLTWLGDTLPGPLMPRMNANDSGFSQPKGTRSKTSWRDCEQCHDGKTKKGPCGNCDGNGGWHYDPMDEKRRALLTSVDAHPRLDRPVVRVVRTSSVMDEDLAEHKRWAEQYGYEPFLPPVLMQLVDGLAALRQESPPHRAILQRVYLIRLDRLEALNVPHRLLHDQALDRLAGMLGEFKAPKRVREQAAARLAA